MESLHLSSELAVLVPDDAANLYEPLLVYLPLFWSLTRRIEQLVLVLALIYIFRQPVFYLFIVL